MGDEDVKIVAQCYCEVNYLKSLNLGHNLFGDKSVPGIVSILEKNEDIKYLSLRENGLYFSFYFS